MQRQIFCGRENGRGLWRECGRECLSGHGNTLFVPDVKAELVGQRGAVDESGGDPGRHAIAPEPGPLVGRRLCAAGQRVQVQVARQGHQLSAEFIIATESCRSIRTSD
jgi:hypothetical protein